MPDITIYATPADLGLYALNEEAMEGIAPEKIDAALVAASRIADSYLASQYVLPLTAIGVDLVAAVAAIAAEILLTATGRNPEAGRDDVYKIRRDAAERWLSGVQQGKARPAGMAGSASAEGVGGQGGGARPLVSSSSQRGYSSRNYGRGGGFIGD